MPSTSRDSSSFDPEAISKPCQELLKLGDALVGQLHLDQSNDILGRWMAHHLARLLTEAEAATGEEKEALEQRCFEAVLAIWKHRNCLPNGLRPLEPAERLLGIVEALDSDAPKSMYSPAAMQWDDLDLPDQPTDEETQRLSLVWQFDRAARFVIRHLLGRMVEDLPEDTREWVRRAQAASAEGPDTITIRRLLLASGAADAAKSRKEGETRKWRSRLEEMDRFLAIAGEVRADLASRLVDAELEEDSNAF